MKIEINLSEEQVKEILVTHVQQKLGIESKPTEYLSWSILGRGAQMHFEVKNDSRN